MTVARISTTTVECDYCDEAQLEIPQGVWYRPYMRSIGWSSPRPGFDGNTESQRCPICTQEDIRENPKSKVTLMNQIIPAYIWSGHTDRWEQLLSTVQKRDLVIFNGPNSGPPTDADDSLAPYIREVQARGAYAFGYVYIGFGSEEFGRVVDHAVQWQKKGITRVFFDAVSGNASTAWMRKVTGMLPTPAAGVKAVFNKGVKSLLDNTEPPASTLVITYEGAWETKPESFFFKYNEAGIAYNAPFTGRWPEGPKYSWATTDTLPNPWNLGQ